MNPYKWHYGNYNVQYYFLNYLQNREFSALRSKGRNAFACANMRNMRVHNIQGFKFFMEFLRMFDIGKDYNMYYSMAKFRNGIPERNLKNNDWEKEKFEEWNENCHNDIIGYDMLIDIDAGEHDNIDYAVDSAKRIRNRLNHLNVPYQLRFSGMGFHFIIPSRYFVPELIESDRVDNFNPHKDGNVYQDMMKIAQYLYDVDSEMIDKDLFDSRRLAKLPYSLSIYDDAVFVCKPVNPDELDYFKIEKYLLINNKMPVLDADTIYNPDGNVFKLIEAVNGKEKNSRRRKAKDC